MNDATERRQLEAALAAHRAGDVRVAEQGYRKILARRPTHFDALNLCGVLLLDRGDVQGALVLLRRAVAVQPRLPQSQLNLARALLASGDWAAALSAATAGRTLAPNDPEAHFAMGHALQLLNRHAEATEAYEHVLRLNERHATAWSNGAEALRQQRRFTLAEAWATRALAVRPGYPQALNHLGLVFYDRGEYHAAIEAFRAALAIAPAFTEAVANVGTALLDAKDEEAAAATLDGLATLIPDRPYLDGQRFYARARIALWQDWDTLKARLDARLATEPGGAVEFPHSVLGHEGRAAVQQAVATAYSARVYPAHEAPIPQPRRMGSRLRIGYFSGDFGEHPVAYLLAAVFEGHDRERLECHAFGWGRRADTPMRGRLRAAFEHFHDVTEQSDEAIVAMARQVNVDVAVDLGGHTAGQRTGVFARRAAPVQVNFLGLPATMGAPYIDYLIADRRLVPEEHRPFYTEAVVWMPDTFQPSDDRRPPLVTTPRRALGLDPDSLVLAAFNETAKLTPSMFATWLMLLRELPDAVLWLLAPEGACRERLQKRAAEAGVAPARLVFAGRLPYAQHLARLGAADLFLDTAPFSGGATANDALAAGLPIVTVLGESFAARMAASLLGAIGLDELVGTSLDDYARIALALGRDRPRLAALKAEVTTLRRSHPAFDSARYARHLEAAFATMAARAASGEPAASFAVTPLDGAGC